MTLQELYESWCKRMSITTQSIINQCKAGNVTAEWQQGFCEAVEASRDTIKTIIEELN